MFWPHTKTFVVLDRQININSAPGCAGLEQPSHKQQRIFTKLCAYKLTLL
jgi:hypothetical protein